MGVHTRLPMIARARHALCCLLALTCASTARARECGEAEMKAEDITGCTSLHHIRVLGHSGAIWLGDALHHNVDLKYLDLHHTKIHDPDAISIANGLINNTHLKRLRTHRAQGKRAHRLRAHRPSAADCAARTRPTAALRPPAEMHNNHIRDEGAKAFGRALAENDSLEFLALSSNGIRDAGAVGLAEGLKKNRALKRLDLYFNVVGDEGAKAFADALRVNTKLRQLHLDNNQITSIGGLALADAIHGEAGSWLGGAPARATHLGELGLNYNPFDNKAVAALTAAAAANPTLHRLDVNQCTYVHGEVLEHVKSTHRPTMEERKRVADWIVDEELIDGGHHSDEGPPLATVYAPAVTELGVHTADGLQALRHHTDASLRTLPVVAQLPPKEQDIFVAKILDKVAAATNHDEL
jgi:hypothetical protein